MPKKLTDCVAQVKKQAKQDHPDWSDDRISDYAWGTCVKSTGLHPGDDESMSMHEEDCHKLAGDSADNYAIPRIKALPYKGEGGPSKACVQNAMARLNQVHGATPAEKARALRTLRRVASSLGMDVSDEESDSSIHWNSKIAVYESFDSALTAFKRPDVKIYGLEEAKAEELRESTVTVAATTTNATHPPDTHFYITGEAIHSTTTANLHTYPAEELATSAPTLAGKPLMVDHGKGSMDVAGKVLISSWENKAGLDGAVSYIARIRKTHPVAETVKVGDISTVSIGAVAEKIECSICGEDMRYCTHHIGQKYETDNGEKMATAVGRGLTFRELSITPFPADTGASAHVHNDSLFSAIEMLVESCEYKPTTLQKAGKEQMSKDNTEELAAAYKDVKDLKGQLEQLQKDKEEAHRAVLQFQEEKKADLVDKVFGMEVAANISSPNDEKARKLELKSLSTDVLDQVAKNLKKMNEALVKASPSKGKAVVADVPQDKKGELPPLTYHSEEIKAGLRQALGGMRTSESAQRTVRRTALDPANPNAATYKALVKKNIEKVLGRKE